MELRREEFPVALQAYEVRGDHEDFVAEQVVNSQVEADHFMSLYAGRLIKTREVRPVETRRMAPNATARRRMRAGMPAWIIILAVLIILFVVAYATGWLQTMVQQVK